MLPKTILGRAMASKVKVYAGADHPHGAQKPVRTDDQGLITFNQAGLERVAGDRRRI
jgi:hypothetical protein